VVLPAANVEPAAGQVDHRSGPAAAALLDAGHGHQQVALQLDHRALVAVAVADQGAQRRAGQRGGD